MKGFAVRLLQSYLFHHDKTDRVIPSQSEESSAMWMLRFVQHDSVWMLHCATLPSA